MTLEPTCADYLKRWRMVVTMMEDDDDDEDMEDDDADDGDQTRLDSSYARLLLD